jgi:hypothetical protein
MMAKRVSAIVVFWTAALSLSAAQVVAERLNYTIVLPDNPSAVCKLAGAELASFLEKTYEEPLRLNGNTQPVTFYVGVSGEAVLKGFSDLPDMRGTFGVFRKDRNILCYGWDDEGVEPETQNWGEAGTLLAVYYFLNHYAGVGFYFPGENGFSIKKEKALNVDQAADIASPSFELRGFSMKTTEFSERDKLLFFRRALCSIPKWDHIDIYEYMNNWKERFWESRPDYFMLRNGTRVWEKYPMQGLCLSNPDLARQAAADIVEDLNKNPQKTTVRLFLDCPLRQCQCERCSASAERSYAGVDTESCEEFYGFQKRVADIVHQSHPGIHFLTQTKSWSYYKPPRLVHLDNFFTVSIMTWQHTTRILDQKFLIEVAKMWQAAGVRTTLFGYPRWTDAGTQNMPVITPKFLAENLRAFHGLSCGTQTSELNSNPYSFSALNQFLQAKLLFDIRADLDTLIKEFCSFAYPGAEKEMAAFYESMEALYVQRGDLNRDAFADIYQPANLKKPMLLLDTAKEKVKPGSVFFEKLYQDFGAFYQRSLGATGKTLKIREILATIRANGSRPVRLTRAKGFANFESAPDTWPDAVRCELLTPNDDLEPQKASAYLACDGDFLYLSLVAAEKNPEKIVTKCKQDGSLAVFGDDCVEFLLIPPDSEEYYQIGINSAGHYTVRQWNLSFLNTSEPAFAFQMDAQAEVLADGWVAKVRIPLAQFAPTDLKKPWRFNVYRSRLAGGKGESYGILLLSKKFHQNFELFPHLIFPEAAAK